MPQPKYVQFDGNRVKERYIWIGNASDSGNVKGKRVGYFAGTDKYGETPTHGILGVYSGSRWRYTEDSGFVFWWESPSEIQIEGVNRFLKSKGIVVKRHIMGGDADNGDDDTIFDLAHGHYNVGEVSKSKLKSALSKYTLRDRQQVRSESARIIEAMLAEQDEQDH